MKHQTINSILLCVCLFSSLIQTKTLLSTKQVPASPFPGSYCTINKDCWNTALTVPNSFCENNKCKITCGMLGNSYCNDIDKKFPEKTNYGIYRCVREGSNNFCK